MGKNKRDRKESSESESDSDDSSSSTSDSSSNTSSSADSKVKTKKNKIKHMKKKSNKESSSSSSSSSSSEDDSRPPKKRKQNDTSKSHKKTIETSLPHDKQHSTDAEIRGEKRCSQNLHYRERQRTEDQERHSDGHRNNSKWDSPSYSATHEKGKNRYHGRDNRGGGGGDDERDKNYRQRVDFQRPRSPRRNFDSRDDGYNHSNRFDNRNRGIDRRHRTNDNDRGGGGGHNRDNRNTDQNYRHHDNYSNKDGRDRYREDRNENQTYNRRRSPQRRRKFDKNSNDEQNTYEWGKEDNNSNNKKKNDNDEPPAEKEKPNFGLSGKLTEDTNKVNGVIIKYSEPDEARKPKRRWRLYPFKGETALPTLYIHRQSCFLIGRDRKVCDLPIDHPSCSKQHAALQYRLVPYNREDGTTGRRVRPYIIDLESANGTFVNNKRIDTKKYVELLEKDVIKFGFSSREYVMLHENSKEDQLDDDVIDDPIDSTEVKTELVE